MPIICAAPMPKSFSRERAEMIRVRAAIAADIPRFVEIAAHSATASRWNQNQYLQLFAQNSLQAQLALVVEEGGEVVGFIVGKQVDFECEIENIAISGAARRRGLGTRLLGEFLELIRGRGGRVIWLEVRESNLAARALYEKWAFVESGRRKTYYQDPAEDALILKFSFP
jgi:ribosomal-protein-alanine acetyltransferase